MESRCIDQMWTPGYLEHNVLAKDLGVVIKDIINWNKAMVTKLLWQIATKAADILWIK